MGFKEAVRTCLLEKYVTFSGRASRSEYWWFFLFTNLVSLALMLLIVVSDDPRAYESSPASLAFTLAYCLFLVATILPGISVAVRRCHDHGRSGWWLWISLVPILGGLLLLAFSVMRGTAGRNAYGADPLKLRQTARRRRAELDVDAEAAFSR